MGDTRTRMAVDNTGAKIWRVDGDIHRTDGPAIVFADGSKNWCQHNKLHRTDGPAIENADGTKAWLLDDDYHRTDGPAIEYTSGSMSWYLRGDSLSFDEWLDQNQTLTDEEKVMFKLQYG
jgi:hypothetical protein